MNRSITNEAITWSVTSRRVQPTIVTASIVLGIKTTTALDPVANLNRMCDGNGPVSIRIEDTWAMCYDSLDRETLVPILIRIGRFDRVADRGVRIRGCLRLMPVPEDWKGR